MTVARRVLRRHRCGRKSVAQIPRAAKPHPEAASGSVVALKPLSG
jgi:hypothetical protein